MAKTHSFAVTWPIGFNLDSKEKADLIDLLEALTDHSCLSNPEIQSPFR